MLAEVLVLSSLLEPPAFIDRGLPERLAIGTESNDWDSGDTPAQNTESLGSLH